MSNFKAADYIEYNCKIGFDKYKYLYSLMEELFNLLPFDEKDFDDDFSFTFSGMNVYIDKKNNSYCEVINTGTLSINERIKIHQEKINFFKKDIIQLNLF